MDFHAFSYTFMVQTSFHEAAFSTWTGTVTISGETQEVGAGKAARNVALGAEKAWKKHDKTVEIA